MSTETLELHGEPDAVPTARRFVTALLARWGRDDVVDAAELAASELVTNGLLHAGPPVRLVVAAGGDGGVRLEVYDGSHAAPVLPRAPSDAMTGRGLALVDAIAARWGSDPTADGKVVWAELRSGVAGGPTGPVDGGGLVGHDADALLNAFADDWSEETDRSGRPDRYPVTLGDVPTDLLLAAKAHVDSLTRELTLTMAGAAAGLTTAVPPHLAALVEGVVSEFGEARQEIKRQALLAESRGEARTALTLTLPAAAADAGERYLAALEEADGYARAARLLTLEAPPQHRAFRRWYVTSLVAALRRAAAGLPSEPAPSFEEYLLGEVGHLAELQRMTDRAARLQRVTAALAGTLTSDEVSAVMLREAVAEMAARRAVLVRLDGERPTIVGELGYGRERVETLTGAAGEPIEAVVAAFSSGEPVWVESRQERDRRFPAMRIVEGDADSFCAVPLLVAGRPLAVLCLAFGEPRLFDADERAFLTAVAAAAAQALERAELYQAQARVVARLGRLQAVAAELGRARNLAEVADVVLDHAAGALGARVGSLCMLAEDGRTIEAVRTLAVEEAQHERWRRFDVDDPLPVAEAVRTRSLVAAGSLAERDARWPMLVGAPPAEEHALVCLPLVVGERALGALTLSFPGARRVDPSEAEFLTALADACAQALDRAGALERLSAANLRLTFLARASEELSSSLDVDRTLAGVARLAVPELADWCVIHLLRDGALQPVAIAHVDPEKVALAEQAQRRWPERVDGTGGVASVVRTGEPILVPTVTDAMIDEVPHRDSEHAALLREVGLSSVLIVPLVARERILGAVTLILAESARHYDEDDLAFAKNLAGRAAVAIDNATLFAELAERRRAAD